MKMRTTLALLGAATMITGTAFAQGAPAKPAEAKPAEAKPAMPTAAKPAEAKPAEAMPVDAKMDPKKAAQMQKMMEAMQKYSTPGPEHENMKKMVGTWKANVKFWENPKAPPKESTGSATFKMVLGDRYLMQEFTGDMMGQPFTGWSMAGFDNASKQFHVAWFDSMGTGRYLTEGTADKTGKVVNYKTSFVDPMTGKKKTGKETMKMNDDGSVLFIMDNPGMKMEILYTRSK